MTTTALRTPAREGAVIPLALHRGRWLDGNADVPSGHGHQVDDAVSLAKLTFGWAVASWFAAPNTRLRGHEVTAPV